MHKLYKKSKNGKLSVWWIDHYGDHGAVDMVTKSGYDGMKIKEHHKQVLPNQLFPSAIDRAEKLSITKYEKKMREGFVEDKEEALSAETPKNPMQCLRVDIEQIKSIPVPCIAEEKINGVCGWYDHSKPHTLFSKTGKEQDIPHLREQIQNLINNNTFGITIQYVHFEFFKEGLRVNEVNSLVQKPTEETEDLCAYIFDVVPAENNMDTLNRCKLRNMAFVSIEPSLITHLRNVPWAIMKNHKDLATTYHEIVKNGGEGIIARGMNDLYLFDNKNSRSMACVKIKPVYSREFKVINMQFDRRSFQIKGKRGLSHKQTFMLVEFICETEEGKTFKAIPAWSREKRHEYYEKGIKTADLGLLTVEYREVTQYGVPFNAVAIDFRDDI